MHALLEAKLKEPPEELFSRAACHTFAREFVRMFSDMGACLRRAGCVFSVGDVPKGLHVYAYKDGRLFDVGGRREEKSYLQTFDWSWWDCSEEELFTVVDHDEKGPLNRWRHYLDQSFVDSAGALARHFIGSHRALWFSEQNRHN